eukprot:Em0005g330a
MYELTCSTGDAQSLSCDSNIAQPLCPGTITKCTCAITGVVTQWNFPTLNLCPSISNLITLAQLTLSSSSSSGTCGAYLSAATNSPSQAGSACPSSTLTITANQSLNGLTIECRDITSGSRTLIGTRNITITASFSKRVFIWQEMTVIFETIQLFNTGTASQLSWQITSQECFHFLLSSIIFELHGRLNLALARAAPPSAPTTTSLISTYSDQRTVTWTSVLTATSYSVSINASGNTPYTFPSTGAPQYTFTGLTNNTVYTVSVVAINCAGSSSPATMTTNTMGNGPAAPSSLPPTPSTTLADACTAAVGSSIGTAVGVSVSVTFVVSFSMGVLVAYVLGYISRRSKESSHKPSSHADPATVYDESVGITFLASMALAMALTRVIFSLPNMSLITLALRNEEEPKTKHVANRVKVLLASSPQLHFSSSTHPPTCLSQNSRSLGYQGNTQPAKFSTFGIISPVAGFSQNITWGVVSCHNIIPMLTSDGMMSKRVKVIARVKCTLGPIGCDHTKPPLHGSLMDWWIKCKPNPCDGTTYSQEDACGEETESNRALSAGEEASNSRLNMVTCLSPRMQRSHFIFFLILPSIIHGFEAVSLWYGDYCDTRIGFWTSLCLVLRLGKGSWTGSGFQCSNPSVAANTIQLTQSSSASLNTVPGSCGNLSAVMTNISGTCYTSVLTIPTSQYFNGTTVTCRDYFTGTLIGNDTLNIQLASPPNAPTITSLINTYSDLQTVTWTSVPTATSYNVSINDSVNTLVPIPSTGAPQYTFTGLTNNTVYTVSVVAINCAGSSSPATITGRKADCGSLMLARTESHDVAPFSLFSSIALTLVGGRIALSHTKVRIP